MPSFFNVDDSAADVHWGVTRGDDPVKIFNFYDVYKGEDHPDNVPSDLTGYTYISSVSAGREAGHTVIVSPTPVVADPTSGELIVTMTDTQTDLLVNSTYVWDLVENPGTTTENTLVDSRITVSGRATP